MSVNDSVTTAADVTTGGDGGDGQNRDAVVGESSADPAAAEVSKGVASLPSPNKTGAGRQQMVYSILEETPPWTRESFLFNLSSFQEDVSVGASPFTTGRLTPGLRRLCLDGSPCVARAKAERHSYLHSATSPTLENETPPWMKVSFMDCSVTTPTEPANSVELPGGAGTATAVPLPDSVTVTLDVQNDTMDVQCEGKSPIYSVPCTPEVDSTGAQNAVDSPCRDSPASAIASSDRQAILINSTMDLPGGSNTPGSAGDLTVPMTDDMNSTTNLTSGHSSPSVAERNASTSADEINKTTDVANNSTPSIALTSDVNTSTGERDHTVELERSGGPNMAVPAGGSVALSDVDASSSRQMNGTMELAGSVGSAADSKKPTAHQDLTVEMGSDGSLISPAVSPSVSRPSRELNATVDKEHDGKFTAAEVNTTMPVHHNTTVDFPHGDGTNNAPMAVCHNGTLDLTAAETPVATKLAGEMNSTVDLVHRRSITSAGPMNSTVELQSTTTTSNASPSVTAEVHKLTSSAVTGVGSPAVAANGTVNLTSSDSPCVAAAAVVNGTVNLTHIASPCVTGAAVVNSTVNLTCNGSPSVSGVQKLDNTVEMEVSNPSSGLETARGHAAVNDQANGVNEECTSPASDTAASAAECTSPQASVANAPACADNGTVSDSATLTMNLNLSEAEVTVERSAPESRLSAHFALDDSLDLQACSLVTSTPMPEHREFSFPRPADLVLSRVCEARKQLVLPANTTITKTTANATTSSCPTAKATDGSDSPGEDGAETSPAEISPPSEGATGVHASLAQRRGMVPKASGITLPRAGGPAAAMAAPAPPGAKSSGLPVTRRTIPKPTRRIGLLGMATVANSTVEGIPAPSGIPNTNRLSLGMKAALRSATSTAPVPQPSLALQRRLSLAPALSTRLKKKPNEGAIPTVSKEAAASSVRPSRVSAGVKRPVPEPKGGPAKRSKEDSTHTSVSKDPVSIAGRPSRTSTGLRKGLPEPKVELRRPSVGPASKLKSGLLMKKGPVLPTVPEDAISSSSNHTISASLVTAPSLDSEGTYVCDGQEHPDCKTDCKNCECLRQQNQQLRQENEALKAQLIKMQNP